MTNHASFWENAAAHPERAALITGAGRVVTFGELASQANRLATGLRQRGIGVGDTIAMMAANRPEYFAVQLAALQSGIVLALVNRHLTESEAAHILSDSQAQLLIADDRTGAAAAAAAARAGLDAGARFAIDGDSGFTDWRELWGADEPPTDRTDWLAHPGSVGKARSGADVQIRDEDGNLVPPGTVGLIHLRAGRTFEYHNDPAKTARSHRDGYFVPGDLGSIDDEGYLYLSDRRTDMIVSGGVNIYPAEIESVLLAQPGVADAVVIGVPDLEWGHRVIALVSTDATDLSQDDLRAACARELADYKIPAVIEIVTSLPRNPAGKLSRAKVRAAYAENGAGGVAALG